MFLAIIAILGFLFVWGYQSHASRRHMREATDHIPGPPNLPLLGCLTTALKLSPKNIFKESLKFYTLYGQIVRGWALNRLYISSSDAELNEQILSSSKQITKMSTYGILGEWLGIGLLLSDGKKWHTRRKIITPTFHFKILEEFVEVFNRQATILMECLADKADGQTAFNVAPYICSATLDIIAETAMGTQVNAQTDKNMPYTAAVNEMTEMMAWRFIHPHLNSDLIFTLMHPHKKLRERKLIRILHNFSTRVIEERRQVLENTLNQTHNNSSQDDAPNDVGSKQRMALLDVLLQATVDGKPLSDEDIREEVDTFMFEGHDTTTSALSFTLYLLARHPQVQNKILAEIKQVLGDEEPSSLTLMKLNELKYLECVIKESLRFYPPIPLIGREIIEDFPYKHSKLGNGILPAGTQIILFIIGSLKDRKYYTNADEFIPERHEELDAGTAYAYIPFSAGPRNCIGQKFAMYEMKVILLKILRAYELLPLGEDVEPMLSIVLRSQTGMQLGLRKRIT